jgi:hypothetical protein
MNDVLFFMISLFSPILVSDVDLQVLIIFFVPFSESVNSIYAITSSFDGALVAVGSTDKVSFDIYIQIDLRNTYICLLNRTGSSSECIYLRLNKIELLL